MCGVDATLAFTHGVAVPIASSSNARDLPHLLELSGRIVALGLDPAQPPIPRAGVTVTAAGTSVTTGLDGLFALPDVPSLTVVRITPATDDYYPMSIPAAQVSGEILLMERSNTVLQLGGVDGTRELLIEARDQFEARMYPIGSSVVYSDTPPRYRWAEFPVSVHVPPCSDCTSDLPAAARDAIARWNEAVGFQILAEVPAPPAVGVTVVYGNTGVNIGTTIMTNPPGLGVGDAIPVQVEVRLKPDGGARYMRLVVFHEFGHVLCQRHSPDRAHLMHCFLDETQRTYLHPDEVQWTSFVRFMPQGTDPDWYVLQ